MAGESIFGSQWDPAWMTTTEPVPSVHGMCWSHSARREAVGWIHPAVLARLPGSLPDDVARRRLSQALWQIRAGLDPRPVLLAEGDTVQINPELPLWLDVEQFAKHQSQSVAEGTTDGPARRQARIQRLLQEAAEQGATPTVGDLAAALAVSEPTVRRDLSALRRAGHPVKTRGSRGG
jgi:DNA-binding transcriptional ArsR family regulator